MPFLTVYAQAIAAASFFFIIAIGLSSLLDSKYQRPLAVVLCQGLIFASLLFMAIEAIAGAFLRPPTTRWVNIFSAILALIILWRPALTRLRAAWMASDGSLSVLAFAGIFYLLCTAIIPLSPLPGLSTLPQGDVAFFYYNAARRYLNGDDWQGNFFLLDFADGSLPYIESQSLPVFVMAFLMRLFGTTAPTLDIYAAIAAAATVLAMVSMVNGVNQRAAFILALAIFGTPMISEHWTTGSINAVAALGPLTIWTSLMRDDWPSRPARLACLLAILFSALIRPESLLYGVCLILPWGFWCLFFRAQNSNFSRTVLGVAIGVAVVLFAIFPFILAELGPRMRNLSFYYISYDELSKNFRAWENNWSGINRRITAGHFGDPDGNINTAIGFEIQCHPLAFARYAFVSSWKISAFAVARALGLPRWLGAENIGGYVLLAALLAISFWRREQRWPTIALFAFFLIVPLINAGFADRHAATVLPLFLTLALRTFLTLLASCSFKLPRASLGILYAVIGTAGAASTAQRIIQVAEIRSASFQHEVASAAAAVREICPPDEIVISRYPVLIAYAAERPSVGGSHFNIYLKQIEERFNARWLLLDGNLYDAYCRHNDEIENYEMIREDAGKRFVILKRRE